jgi:hypothetical protein
MQTMASSLDIHETAFVTAAYRASDPKLSKDSFANLWSNRKTDTWIAQYVKAVSPIEPLAHCLRNRYFFK